MHPRPGRGAPGEQHDEQDCGDCDDCEREPQRHALVAKIVEKGGDSGSEMVNGRGEADKQIHEFFHQVSGCRTLPR